LASRNGLLASALPKAGSAPRFTASQQAALTFSCKQAEEAATSKGVVPPRPVAVSSACQKLAAEAAVAATKNQRNSALHDLLLFSLLGLGVMTVASAGLGWVMAGRVLRPVSAITGAARRASERHLGERIDLQGPRDELKELADTFDEMLDRLDVAFAGQQRFVANASHELRTPLTVMRTAIDVTLAKIDRTPEQLESMAIKVRRSVDQAEKLIEALLTLAISERKPSDEDVIDLATAVDDAVDVLEPAINARGLELALELEEAEVRGDRTLLERLVANLVDNAVRHNVSDGHIEVRTGSNGTVATIQVTNSGDVVDESLVDFLFEPFEKIDGRTNNTEGVGLGLAIVRSIALAHGGAIAASSRAEGGLCVSVSLPTANGAGRPAEQTDRDAKMPGVLTAEPGEIDAHSFPRSATGPDPDGAQAALKGPT
jgi:signal transduction histidine kinase